MCRKDNKLLYMFHDSYSGLLDARLSDKVGSSFDNVNGSSVGETPVIPSLLPVPDWKHAYNQWGNTWYVHVYGFAVLYLSVSIVCIGIIVKFFQRIWRSKLVLNSMCLLFLSGIFRILFLTVDPYGYSGNFTGVIVGVLSQIIYPLLCASFGLVQTTLLRLTRVDVGKSKLNSCTYLLATTLSYLFCIMLVEVIVFYEPKAKLLLLVDGGLFNVLSLYLCISFICNGFRLSQYASETKRVRKELGNFSLTRRVTQSKSANSLRLSRPQLRITDESHMTIAIASDAGSSSSDGDRTKNKKGKTQTRRVTKSEKFLSFGQSSASEHSETEVLITDEDSPPRANTSSSVGSDVLPIIHPLQAHVSTHENGESRRPMLQQQTTDSCASDQDSDEVSQVSGEKTTFVANGMLENGYLADSEIVIYSPKLNCRYFNKKSSLQNANLLDNHNSTELERNCSTLSVNYRTKPSSISLLRIRQSKMIQRAVKLTYCLTFLYMFACLLQLYTVFGVYGVLSSSFKPDPWPWLIFQTIFRSTEVGICLVSTSVLYIILSNRSVRGRRKLNMSREIISDCVV